MEQEGEEEDSNEVPNKTTNLYLNTLFNQKQMNYKKDSQGRHFSMVVGQNKVHEENAQSDLQSYKSQSYMINIPGQSKGGPQSENTSVYSISQKYGNAQNQILARRVTLAKNELLEENVRQTRLYLNLVS
jgi:hypothetical protein